MSDKKEFIDAAEVKKNWTETRIKNERYKLCPSCNGITSGRATKNCKGCGAVIPTKNGPTVSKTSTSASASAPAPTLTLTPTPTTNGAASAEVRQLAEKTHIVGISELVGKAEELFAHVGQEKAKALIDFVAKMTPEKTPEKASK